MKEKTLGSYEIDLLRLVKALWKRIWFVVLAGIVVALLGLSCAKFLMTPKYQASILLYVNNSSASGGGPNSSFSSSELSAAQSLVDTYVVILKSRTTLNEVIEKTDVAYSYEELSKMVSASAENETEIFRVTVTSENAAEAADIANVIANVLPKTIANVVEGSSVGVVDYAAVNDQKVSPSYAKFAVVGFLLGVLGSTGVVLVTELMDDIIHDEDYLTQTYDIPVLALIPDLVEQEHDGYGYYTKPSTQKERKEARE